MKKAELRAKYSARHGLLESVAESLLDYLETLLVGEVRVDRVSTRAKSVDSFVNKASALEDDGTPVYVDPLVQVQDQIGARVVCFYTTDLPRVSGLVQKYFAGIEEYSIVPDSPSEFGYEGKHYVLFLPEDVLPEKLDQEACPNFFELQIKTLFQHAWAEANHDLAYKPSGEDLSNDQKRKVAFTAAQAWGADQIFADLACELLL